MSLRPAHLRDTSWLIDFVGAFAMVDAKI